jgi:hypothetical protein
LKIIYFYSNFIVFKCCESNYFYLFERALKIEELYINILFFSAYLLLIIFNYYRKRFGFNRRKIFFLSLHIIEAVLLVLNIKACYPNVLPFVRVRMNFLSTYTSTWPYKIIKKLFPIYIHLFFLKLKSTILL